MSCAFCCFFLFLFYSERLHVVRADKRKVDKMEGVLSGKKVKKKKIGDTG